MNLELKVEDKLKEENITLTAAFMLTASLTAKEWLTRP